MRPRTFPPSSTNRGVPCGRAHPARMYGPLFGFEGGMSRKRKPVPYVTARTPVRDFSKPRTCGYAEGCDEPAIDARHLCAEHAVRLDALGREHAERGGRRRA